MPILIFNNARYYCQKMSVSDDKLFKDDSIPLAPLFSFWLDCPDPDVHIRYFELRRVITVGGWVELVEAGTVFLNAGPATQQFVDWWHAFSLAKGVA